MFRKEKRKSHKVHSRMADHNDDDKEGILPRLHPKYRERDTGFKMIEILERADLFKTEYNQEGIHDKVLVLQVMPDDYEMRQLTERLEMIECSNSAMKEAQSSAVHEQSESKFSSSSSFTFDLSDSCTKDKFSRLSEQSGVTAESTVNRVENSEACSTEMVQDRFEPVARDFNRESSIDEDKSRYECEAESNYSACGVHHYKSERKHISPFSCVANSDSDEMENEACEKKLLDEPEVSSGFETVPRTSVLFQEAKRFRENTDQFDVCLGAEANNSGVIEGESYIEKPAFQHVEVDTGNEAISCSSEETDSRSAVASHDVGILREHRIFVHRCWLAVNSRYFRSLLFESGMRECSGTEFSMKVTETEENGFLLLLRSIYDPDVLENIEISDLLNVLRLSVKYDVRFSTIKAKRVLGKIPLTLESCEAILEALNSGGLPDLTKEMRNVEILLLGEFASLDETWESEKFVSLSQLALRFLLENDQLIVQSENTVFIALMHWIEANAKIYGDITAYSDLLSLVRFELIKPTYINDVVRENEIFTQLDNCNTVYLEAITYHALPPNRRGISRKHRQLCPPKPPIFMWILYPEKEMFSFNEETSSTSTESSSFWYIGYKMHLRLDLSASQDESHLYLVIKNLSPSGSVEIEYDVDVKFGEALHKNFTCNAFKYGEHSLPTPPGNYPFDDSYSLGEIEEMLLGGSTKVAITFEVTSMTVND